MAWVPSAHRADTLFTSAKASRAAVHNEKFFSMPAAGEKKAGNVPAGKEKVMLLRCVLIEQQQLRVLRGGRQDGGHGLLGLGDVHPCAGRVGHACGGLYGRQPMYQKLFAGWH